MTKSKLALYSSFVFMVAGLMFMVHSYAIAEKPLETWKIFDDGVTYWLEDNSSWGNRNIDIGVMLDGEQIKCDNFMFMHGGIISPECVEVILRHELDRRGL